MKIITCAGYYGTGSSAVTDLLGEFDNVHFMGDYEFRFIQDPGGIADLEYNIVENYHRHNSGHALKRYKRNVDFLAGNRFLKRYEGFFNGQFKKLSYQYIDSLTAFRFKGYWHQDVVDKGLLFWVYERILSNIFQRLIVPVLRGKNNLEPKTLNLMPNEYTLVPYASAEYFYSITQDYLEKLFSIANKDEKEFIMVDQLVPPSNSQKYCKYFKDIKIISVDRDPRDIYLLEKEIWKGGCVPTENIEDFCKWYELTRHHLVAEKDDPQKVLRIQFEDMVYHYQETIERIFVFLGLDKDHHKEPRSKFNPDKSIRNTQIWKRYPERIEEMRFIEKTLEKYCYKNY